MSTKRVYSPDGEPFDLPESKANALVLEKGWTQTKPDPAAEPAVRTVPTPEPKPDAYLGGGRWGGLKGTGEDRRGPPAAPPSPPKGGRGRRAPAESWREEPLIAPAETGDAD